MVTKEQTLLQEHCEHVLNEAYFSKHPLLRQIELQMSIISSEIKKVPTYNATNSKENKIIMRNVEKLFNVESCSVIWLSDYTTTNAFTSPVSHLFQFKNNLKTERTKTGIKFAKPDGLHMVIVMQNGLVVNYNATGADLTAVMLHEIGHNFYNTDVTVLFNKYISTFSIVAELITTIMKTPEKTMLIAQKTLSTFIFKSSDVRKDINKMINGGNTLVGATARAMDLINLFIKLLNSMFYFNTLILKMLIAPVLISSGLLNFVLMIIPNMIMKRYENERFSDTFASMHGYSEEIVRFRVNLEKPSNATFMHNALKNIPPIYYICIYIESLVECTLRLCIPYDNGRQSAKSQISYLQKELDSMAYDPKLKKELQAQIDNLKKIEAYANSPRHSLETANLFRLMFGAAFKNFNINQDLNKVSYAIRGKKFDSSFEDILDKKQFI